MLPIYLIALVIEQAIHGYVLERKIPHIAGKAIREKPEWLATFNRLVNELNREEIARLAYLSLDANEKQFRQELATDRDVVRRFLTAEATDDDIAAAYQQIAQTSDSSKPEVARVVEDTFKKIGEEQDRQLEKRQKR